MLLLEYHPKTEETENLEESTFNEDNLLQRTCFQCGFYFYQDKDEMLKCLCWNCREPKEENANPETLPIRIIPSFIPHRLAFGEI